MLQNIGGFNFAAFYTNGHNKLMAFLKFFLRV